MAERSFWRDYATRAKQPAPRPALYNRVTRTGAQPPPPPQQNPKRSGPNVGTVVGAPATAYGIHSLLSSQPEVAPTDIPWTPVTPPVPEGPQFTPVPPPSTPVTPPGVPPSFIGIEPTTTAANVSQMGYGPPAAIALDTIETGRGVKNLLQNDRTSGARDWYDRGTLAVHSGGISEVARPVIDAFSSRRHPDDARRKGANESLRSSGFLDENYNVQGPNGAFFNIGEDETHGGTKVSGQEGAMIEGRTPGNRAYNLNMDDPMTGEYIGSVQPLVDILLPNGNDDVARGQMVAKLVNAAVSSGDPMGFIKHLYTQGGYTDRNSAYSKVLELSQDAERLPPDRRDAYLAAIDKMYGVPGASGGGSPAPAAQTSGGSSGGGSRPTPAAAPAPPPAAAPTPPPVPGAPDVNFPQAIADVYANNTSDPVTTLLNPVTAPPFTPNQPSALDLQPLARRRRR